MKEGKRFEANFKDSVPAIMFWYRFKDGTSSWGGNEKIRFQSANICDYIVCDGRLTYLFELKSHLGNSVPFKAIVDFEKKTSAKKIQEMIDADIYDFMYPAYVFNMREKGETWIVKARDVYDFICEGARASIPLEWMRENGTKLLSMKKQVNYTYIIEEALDKIVRKRLTSKF